MPIRPDHQEAPQATGEYAADDCSRDNEFDWIGGCQQQGQSTDSSVEQYSESKLLYRSSTERGADRPQAFVCGAGVEFVGTIDRPPEGHEYADLI